ncbi:MAG TPA: GNAT family N-acetyltransferase [Dongiaceae bacterium]
MKDGALRARVARIDELSALDALMELAIGELLKPFLTEAEIASSRAIMGLDSQLVRDGTYFVVEDSGALAGCGGWSRRATMYGGDVSPGRDPALLDPAKDAARVRAMYTHPSFVRRGVGRLILACCEDAARAEGFIRAELVATMAGLPLYTACGYKPVERFTDERGGVPVPLARMTKTL